MSSVHKCYANLQRGQYCCGVYYRGDRGDLGPSTLTGRGCIDGFTPSSRKRLRRYLRNSEADYRVFATLTYPIGYGVDMHRVKRDVEAFVRRVRRYVVPRETKRPWSLCWFVEWQANGRAHIHFYHTHYLHRHWLSQAWYEIVGSSDFRHLAAGTNIKRLRNREQSTRYALKYATKSDQKLAPTEINWIGRFWGVRGVKSTVEASTSFSENQSEGPEVAEALENVRKIQKKCLLDQKMIRREIDIGGSGRSCVLYLWSMDNESIRMMLLPYILVIQREVANEY